MKNDIENDMKNKRNLKILYSSPEDPAIQKDKEDAEAEVNKFITKRKWKKEFLKSAKKMKEALDEYEKLHNWNIQKPYNYFYLKSLLNSWDKSIQAYLNQVHEHIVKVYNNITFFELDIAKITNEDQKRLLSDKLLLPYNHFLKNIFAWAKYNLWEEAEQVFSSMYKTSCSNRKDMLNNFLEKEEIKRENENEEKTQQTFEGLLTLAQNTNKKTRIEAAKHLNIILEKHSDLAEIEINSILEFKKQSDDLRKLPRPEIQTHLRDDIPTEVVDTLVETVHKHNQISQDFYKLKAQLLGQKKINYEERAVEIWKIKRDFSYNKWVKIVSEVFTKLHPKFMEIFSDFLREKRIDVYPNKWKSGGACQISFTKNLPNRVLLNYTNTINDVTTLGHEMWHAIHTILCRKQNTLQSDYGIAIAEVASTFMEGFCLEEIRKDISQEDELTLLMQTLDQDISSIHRQIACYTFEQELHATFREKWYLSKETIWKLFVKHMKHYMGSASNLENAHNWWIYWSHIRSFFYVYSYAGGILIAKALQKKVKKDAWFIDIMIEEFLSKGSSSSPAEIFKNMGIDICDKNFRGSGLLEIQENLEQAQKLAKKIWKI